MVMGKLPIKSLKQVLVIIKIQGALLRLFKSQVLALRRLMSEVSQETDQIESHLQSEVLVSLEVDQAPVYQAVVGQAAKME